jgi:type VI secretion system protein ImpA
VFDFSPWLTPIGGANPSGESLRNDARFHEIERLMQPVISVSRNERNEPVSETVAPIEWGEVLRRADELRASGRDLRLLVIVARALANERGLAGLADGLSLIAQSVESHWDTLHPEMREGSDPLAAARPRINAVMQLKNPKGVLGDMRRHVFFAVRGLGPVTGRDLERGTLDVRSVLAESPPGLDAARQAEIASAQEQLIQRVRKACTAQNEQAPAEIAALAEAARGAVAALDALEAALAARVGVSVTLAHTSEESIAASMRHFLSRVLATLTRPTAGAEAGAEAAGEPGEPLAAGSPAPAGGAAGARGLPDRLASRDEVTKCLDLIISFYDRTEPASPIPHIARRLRRMVPMDFLALMEDVAPAGLKEFRYLAGVEDSSRKPTPRDER